MVNYDRPQTYTEVKRLSLSAGIEDLSVILLALSTQ